MESSWSGEVEYTQDFVCDHLGGAEVFLTRPLEMHKGTLDHSWRLATLGRIVIGNVDSPAAVRAIIAFLTHDIGKSKIDPELLDSEVDFIRGVHDAQIAEIARHAEIGGSLLGKRASWLEHGGLIEMADELRTAEFVAINHHKDGLKDLVGAENASAEDKATLLVAQLLDKIDANRSPAGERKYRYRKLVRQGLAKIVMVEGVETLKFDKIHDRRLESQLLQGMPDEVLPVIGETPTKIVRDCIELTKLYPTGLALAA